MSEHTAENDAPTLDALPIRQRDRYVAQVMRFLIERGYTITAPGATEPCVIPPGSTVCP